MWTILERAERDSALSKAGKRGGFAKWEEGWKADAGVRVCDHGDCELEAGHRAPRSRDHLGEYYWFCLEHVREYNARWNYFEGMKAEDINQFQYRNAFWHRPTWRVSPGRGAADRATADNRFSGWRCADRGDDLNDPFGLFDDLAGRSGRMACRETRDGRLHQLDPQDRRAFQTLELDIQASASQIKDAFKRLAKACHPDMTGGNKRLEDRFRAINDAYQHCVKSGFC